MQGCVVSEDLSVTVPTLHASAQHVSESAEHLATAVTAVDTHVDGLIGKSWSGDASAAFGKVWRQWHEGAESVASGMSTLANLMDESGQHYKRVDGGS